jgi:hypothetical protein
MTERGAIISEALEKLAEAEELVRSLRDPYLDAYVADQINAEGLVLGDGLFQILEKEGAEE